MDRIEQAYATYCELRDVAVDAADGDSNDAEIEALTDALDQAGLLIELYRELTGRRSDEDQAHSPQPDTATVITTGGRPS